MRRAALLGSPGSKRAMYLMQAAQRVGIPLSLVQWQDWRECLPEGELFLKIDPPDWESCCLTQLDGLAADYREQLKKLSERARKQRITFLNHPSAIAQLLDKRGCKEILRKAGLPVTEQLAGTVSVCGNGQRAEALLRQMRKLGICQVFIKPVWGSGAAGVFAFRWQPARDRMALYTCTLLHPKLGLVNTKRLRRISQPEEIFALLDRLLELDCVVERWYAKADYRGFSYDLRAVVQDERVDFLLARLSQGPITNLHLNNHPLDAADLGLSREIMTSLEELCWKAMGCFPGLRSAGIDILLEKGSLTPRIIEMNGQGDLIYRDIGCENMIYGHQAEMMRRWLAADKQQEVYSPRAFHTAL